MKKSIPGSASARKMQFYPEPRQIPRRDWPRRRSAIPPGRFIARGRDRRRVSTTKAHMQWTGRDRCAVLPKASPAGGAAKEERRQEKKRGAAPMPYAEMGYKQEKMPVHYSTTKQE